MDSRSAETYYMPTLDTESSDIREFPDVDWQRISSFWNFSLRS